MAVRGDFSWPSVGNSNDRPRGLLMAAYGEIAMAVDSRVESLPYSMPPIGPRSLQPAGTPSPVSPIIDGHVPIGL